MKKIHFFSFFLRLPLTTKIQLCSPQYTDTHMLHFISYSKKKCIIYEKTEYKLVFEGSEEKGTKMTRSHTVDRVSPIQVALGNWKQHFGSTALRSSSCMSSAFLCISIFINTYYASNSNRTLPISDPRVYISIYTSEC
jgi:hypothetical protein